MFGKVGVGLDIIQAKLHVAGSFRVDTSGTVAAPPSMGASMNNYTISHYQGFHDSTYPAGVGMDLWQPADIFFWRRDGSSGIPITDVLGMEVM